MDLLYQTLLIHPLTNLLQDRAYLVIISTISLMIAKKYPLGLLETSERALKN